MEGYPIHSLAIAPSDMVFCTGADDSTVKVWDFK